MIWIKIDRDENGFATQAWIKEGMMSKIEDYETQEENKEEQVAGGFTGVENTFGFLRKFSRARKSITRPR